MKILTCIGIVLLPYLGFLAAAAAMTAVGQSVDRHLAKAATEREARKKGCR
jgi:hypothetical protein